MGEDKVGVVSRNGGDRRRRGEWHGSEYEG